MKSDFTSRLKYGVSAFAVAAMLPLNIQASYAADDTAADEDITFEEVVVTGSRIKRDGFDNSQPSIVITKEEFEDRAFVNIADLLNEVPAFGSPASSPNGNQNGANLGQNVVNFLGLGSQRTLTIVNGRRFVSSNAPTTGSGLNAGSQVDFNTIPIALIERVETIAIGGAPVYGSDAIAGTINVFLRDDFEGVDISGRYGVSERGDGQQYQIQAVIGGNFAEDRGNVAFSMEYNTQDLLYMNARPWNAVNEPYAIEQKNFADVDGDGELDDVSTIHHGRIVQLMSSGGSAGSSRFFLPSRGVGTLGDTGSFFQFDPSGNLVNFVPGLDSGGSAFFAEGGDGVDLLTDVATIQTPLERITLGGIGHYDINQYVTAFAEFTFNNTRGSEFANQGGFQTFAFPDTSGALQFDATNPFLNAQAVQTLADAGVTSFWMNRFMNDLVNNGEDKIDQITYRIVTGLNGDFEATGREFSWEVSANFGSSDVDTSGVILNDIRYMNALDAVALTAGTIGDIADGTNVVRNGADVVIGSAGATAQVGDIVCQAILDQAQGNTSPFSGNGIEQAGEPFIDGCVPLNMFGVGNMTPGALAWVQTNENSESDMEQRVFSANFQGEFFDFGTGMVKFGVGFEARKEEAWFRTSPIVRAGITRNDAGTDNGGSFTTKEFYGELLVPLITDEMEIGKGIFGETFINSLSFEPAARIVSTNNGAVTNSDTTYTLLGRAQVMNDVTLRGNYTQSIRTPALVELFTPMSNTASWASDPCDSRFIDEGFVPATRRANCESIGLGITDFTSNVVNATVLGKTAGNPNLTAETAKAWTIGIGYVPRWIPGLQISVDYLNIRIEDRITSLTLTTMMQQCYDDVNFQTDPNPICNSFSRDSGGQINDFTTGEFNAALSNFQGVSFDIRYGTEVSQIASLFSEVSDDEYYGDLSWRVNGFRRIQNAVQTVAGVDPDPVIGSFAQPVWSMTVDTTYTYDAFRLFWRMAWQSTTKFSASGDNFIQAPDGSFPKNTGTRAIHNVSFSYDIFENLTAQLTVNNALNRRPNELQQAARDFGNAEIFGRSYVFTVRARF